METQKKETRVKDLPKILIDLIKSKFIINLNGSAKSYFSEIDWTKATDAERLAYCEVRYKEGNKLICLVAGQGFIYGKPYLDDGDICFKTKDLNSGFIVVYNQDNGKFAEIIEDVEKVEPSETKPNPQSIKYQLKGTCVLNESVEMGAEIVKLYTEAGFTNKSNLKGSEPNAAYGVFKMEKDNNIYCLKRHDFDTELTLDQLRSIVRGEKETSSFESGASTNTHNQEFLIFENLPNPSEPVEFKEGEMVEVFTNSEWCKVEYAFFANGKHWFYNVNFKERDTVHVAEQIRKIDPDADLKNIADEVLKAFGHDVKSVKSMLIEMGKRVKK